MTGELQLIPLDLVIEKIGNDKDLPVFLVKKNNDDVVGKEDQFYALYQSEYHGVLKGKISTNPGTVNLALNKLGITHLPVGTRISTLQGAIKSIQKARFHAEKGELKEFQEAVNMARRFGALTGKLNAGILDEKEILSLQKKAISNWAHPIIDQEFAKFMKDQYPSTKYPYQTYEYGDLVRYRPANYLALNPEDKIKFKKSPNARRALENIRSAEQLDLEINTIEGK